MMSRIAYGSIGIVGVIGNAIVLLTIAKVPQMRKTTKNFIWNLAIVDLLINIICVPFKMFKALHPDLQDNPYSIAVIQCKVIPYIAEALTAALINTLVALTVDRYIAIVHPFTTITKRQYRVGMILIWIFALIFSIPEMLVKHLDGVECVLSFPSLSLQYVYYAFDAAENCIVPLCIIIYSYVVIWRIVKNRQLPGENIGNERIREAMEVERIQTMKIIFVITLYFVLSALPLYIAFFAYEFQRDERNQVRYHPIHFWLDWLALTHLFMNPFLYCFMSRNIRKSFKVKVIGRRLTKKAANSLWSGFATTKMSLF